MRELNAEKSSSANRPGPSECRCKCTCMGTSAGTPALLQWTHRRCFHVIRALGLSQMVCEGESIRTFPQHTKCQDRKNTNSICGSCLDYKNQLKEKIFRSVKRLGSIHHVCQLLGVSHHLNVKIITLLCSLKKCMFNKNISGLIILFFSECMLVMVLVLVYKRPLL